MKIAVQVVDRRWGRRPAAIGSEPYDVPDRGARTPSRHDSPRSMAQRKRLAAALGPPARQGGDGLVAQRFPIRVKVQDQDSEETEVNEDAFWPLIEEHKNDKALLGRILRQLSRDEFPIHVEVLNTLIAYEPAKPNKYTSGKNAHLKPKDPRPVLIADLRNELPAWRLEACFKELRRDEVFNSLVKRVEAKLGRDVSVEVCDDRIASCTPSEALIEIPKADVQKAMARVRLNLVFELHNLLRWEPDRRPGDARYALAAEWDEWRNAFLTLCTIAAMRAASADLEIDTEELRFGPGREWNSFGGYLKAMVAKRHTALYDKACANEDWGGWATLKEAEATHKEDLVIREREAGEAPQPKDAPEQNPFRTE